MGTPIVMNGIEYQAEDLSPEEELIFNTHFDNYIAPLKFNKKASYTGVDWYNTSQTRMPNGEARDFTGFDRVSELLQGRRDHILDGLKIAKNLITGTFKGVHGGGAELCFSFVRPWHLLRKATTAAETPAEAWDTFQSTAASGTFTGQGTAWTQGVDNWMGWGAANVNPMNIDKRLLIVLIGVAELTPNSPCQSIQFKIDNVTYNPQEMQHQLQLASSDYRVRVCPLNSILLPPRAAVSSTVYNDYAQVSTLMPIAVVIGQGNALQLQTPPATVTL